MTVVRRNSRTIPFLTTYCNDEIIDMMDNISIGAHRLLMVTLSKLNKPYTVIELSIDDYFCLTGSSADSKMTKVRDPFLELKKECELFYPEGTHWRAEDRMLKFEIIDSWIDSISKQQMLIPKSFFIINRGQHSCAYRLGINIYFRVSIYNVRTLELKVVDVVRMCGGEYSDCLYKIKKDWKEYTIDKIERALDYLLEHNIIRDWGYIIKKNYKKIRVHIPRTEEEVEDTWHNDELRDLDSIRRRFIEYLNAYIYIDVFKPTYIAT